MSSCLHCQKRFTPERKGQTFCSPKCRVEERKLADFIREPTKFDGEQV